MKQMILSLFVLLPFFSFANSDERAKAIIESMKENLPTFKICYKEGLKTNPKLKGKVLLEWDVDESGAVKRAEVKETALKDKAVEDCLVDKLKAIQFAAGPAAKIQYPLLFTR